MNTTKRGNQASFCVYKEFRSIADIINDCRCQKRGVRSKVEVDTMCTQASARALFNIYAKL